MDRDKGYIMLSRKFFSNRMWTASRAFSECEAWLDLIQSARFEASETVSRVGIHDITFGRGQYPAATSYLAKCWGWSEQNVKTFLKKLKREEMITTDSSQGVNVITLCNYNEYNPVKNDDNQTTNQLSNQLNGLNDSELRALLTSVLTNQLTSMPESQPASNQKKNKDKNNINNISTSVDTLHRFNNVRQISDDRLQCECTSQSTNKQCKRRALYKVDGKLYCNQHSRDVLGDIIEKTPKLSVPNEELKTWREDFNVYKADLDSAYQSLLSDVTFASGRLKFYKNLDVRLSLEKAYADYWSTEAGWKRKKASRSKDLDWKKTFTNALDLKSNRVYVSAGAYVPVTESQIKFTEYLKEQAPFMLNIPVQPTDEEIDELRKIGNDTMLRILKEINNSRYLTNGRNSVYQTIMELLRKYQDGQK